jgi:quinolinate synthase
MKTITLENIYDSLIEGKYEIAIEPEIAKRALVPLEYMINMN